MSEITKKPKRGWEDAPTPAQIDKEFREAEKRGIPGFKTPEIFD